MPGSWPIESRRAAARPRRGGGGGGGAPPRAARRLLVALGVVVGAACATDTLPGLTPITRPPTGLVEPGRFVWLDLVTQDVERAKSFYGSLFGWTFREGDRYTEVLHRGAPIAGIVAAESPERGSEWLPSLSVADVDRASAAARASGGIVERGPLDAPGRGRLALVSDPEGALLLLLRASTGDPPESQEPSVGSWLWRELWTHDPEQAARFYTELVGYRVEAVDRGDRSYRVFKQGDALRAGIVEAPAEVKPLWLPYVRVRDPGVVAARAALLGARVVTHHQDAAILIDPTGAPIAVQVWRRSQLAEGGAPR